LKVYISERSDAVKVWLGLSQ